MDCGNKITGPVKKLELYEDGQKIVRILYHAKESGEGSNYIKAGIRACHVDASNCYSSPEAVPRGAE